MQSSLTFVSGLPIEAIEAIASRTFAGVIVNGRPRSVLEHAPRRGPRSSAAIDTTTALAELEREPISERVIPARAGARRLNSWDRPGLQT